MASSEEPSGDAKANTLIVKVSDQVGNEVDFKIREDVPFIRLMKAYCGRTGVDQDSVRFLYDGNRIKDDDTPKGLGMEADDVIDAMVQQTGGRSA